jgi:tetratricopeptide (TPR) repeat protein
MSSSATRTRGLLLTALMAVAPLAPTVVPTVALAQRSTQSEDDSAALVAEGREALKAGDLTRAARALDQAMALNPRRVEAYVLRSAVHAARKEYKQGIALMRRAQALAPADEEVLTALGSHLVLSGDTDAGIPILVEVARKNAARYDAQLLLGHHFHAIGKWPDAIAAFEAYFAHRPAALAKEDSRHRIELADSYLRFRQPQKALELFLQAEEDRATDLRARIGVAWAMAAVDCRKARPLLRELEPVAVVHHEVWLVDGLCALALGDTNEALALGRKYLAKTPRASAAGHALVVLGADAGVRDAAERIPAADRAVRRLDLDARRHVARDVLELEQ